MGMPTLFMRRRGVILAQIGMIPESSAGDNHFNICECLTLRCIHVIMMHTAVFITTGEWV